MPVDTVKRCSCSNERRLKISQSLKGHQILPETRQKISNTLIGHKSSQETRDKLSASHKGLIKSEIHRQHLSEAKKGHKLTAEHRKHISEGTKRVIADPAVRERINQAIRDAKREIPAWNKGQHTNIETCKKISDSNKGKPSPNKGQQASIETRQKQSKAHKGIKPSPLTIQRMSESLRGKKNPSWLGGISFLPYTIEFNNQLKELIRIRDNHKCQVCGVPEKECLGKLSVHHKDYDKNNCLPNNLISLCRGCHSKTTKNRAFWQQYFEEEKL